MGGKFSSFYGDKFTTFGFSSRESCYMYQAQPFFFFFGFYDNLQTAIEIVIQVLFNLLISLLVLVTTRSAPKHVYLLQSWEADSPGGRTLIEKILGSISDDLLRKSHLTCPIPGLAKSSRILIIFYVKGKKKLVSI